MAIRILYLHGMGGGADSRIPGILRAHLPQMEIICRTYSFDPEDARSSIITWYEELHPDLVIGESLGSLQAMRISGVPHLYVSPAPQAGKILERFSSLAEYSLVRRFLNWKYKPRPGERQILDFSPDILAKYGNHFRDAVDTATNSGDYCFAFFGTRDHYRKWGVVNVRKWKQLFGENSCSIYRGTHFMEEEFIHSMLIPKILEITQIVLPG